MGKDNLKDKIKRFFLKLIFCNKKSFVVENRRFYNARPTTVKNSMIAENNDDILKLELYRHRLKHNSLKEEAEILSYLKNCGAMCQPIIKSSGVNAQNFSYMIMEKIEQKEGISLPDVLLAILEQHKFGVFHRDTKTDNVIFNGLIAKIVDYDQSQIREETKSLKPKESITYFIENLAHFWKIKNKLLNIGQGLEEVKKSCFECFSGESFDFSKTNLYKSFEKLPFWEVDEPEIISEGKYNLKNWKKILDEINFKENEKVIDINPDTGALSRYLAKRNCDAMVYSECENELYSTKIIGNIVGLNINVISNIEKEFDTLLFINNKGKNLPEIANLAKRIIIKTECKKDYSEEISMKFKKTNNIKLNEFEELAIYEKFE
ncbi:hypothetical protein IJC60_00600 [bacterium]|nr:hypothetical protein [bacterium]